MEQRREDGSVCIGANRNKNPMVVNLNPCGVSMKVGDLVVEHIDDRIGTIIKIEKGFQYAVIATVLLVDGNILRFPTAYLGRYK